MIIIIKVGRFITTDKSNDGSIISDRKHDIIILLFATDEYISDFSGHQTQRPEYNCIDSRHQKRIK